MIGVLTFHNAVNYGAVLQTYALQKNLQKLGLEGEVADYRNPRIQRVHTFRWNPRNPLGYWTKRRTYRGFHSFVATNIPISSTEIGEENIRNYDTLLVGSDQVWNRHLTEEDSVYYGGGITSGIRVSSYAASMGEYRFENEETERACLNELQRFEVLSVREESLKQYLESKMSQDHPEIVVHPDPVFLLGAEDWAGLAKPPKQKGYILLYMIRRDERLIRSAIELGREKDLPVLWLSDSLRFYPGLKHVRGSSPEEYVGLFQNAEYVVTNSFHGTAFSIIFERSFHAVTETDGIRAERIADLLEQLELTSCGGRNDSIEEAKPDWNRAKTLLSAKIMSANEYLTNFLS